MSLQEKARGTIAEYKMITAGDSVVAGVSGGADSVAMLHFLASLRGEWGISLTALHLNHGLRGDESERDEAFAKGFCGSLGVDFIAEKADVLGLSKKYGLSLEEAGRKARYDFFRREAEPRNAKIATAHSLSDSVETMILNLVRGTDLRGLCGIPAVSGDIIRPLIACERAEIEAYCACNDLEYVTDSSNDSDEFSRNRIRRHVLPVLFSINPGLYKTAASNIAARTADADCLDGLALDALSSIKLENGRFSRDKYLNGHEAIRLRVLLAILEQSGARADARRLSRLDGIVNAGSGAEQLSEKLYFKADKLCFYLETPTPERRPESFLVPVKIPESAKTVTVGVFQDKMLELMNTEYEHYEKNLKYAPSPLKNSLDCGKIVGNLVLRGRLPSDKIRLENRNCTKTLKKLFSEAKIPVPERERIFVLADGEGVVWAEGFGAAARAAPSEATKDVLILNIIRGSKSQTS